MAKASSAAASVALRRAAQWGWLGAVIVAAVLIAVLVRPRAQPKGQQKTTDEARVLAADEMLGAAMRAGDKAAARRLLSLQFSFVGADGKVHARKDFLADLKGLAAAPASDAKVRSYGLIVTVTGRRSSPQNGDAFFLDIWAKQKGAWRVLVMQDVALPEGDAPAAAAAAPETPYECRNPCQTIPYRVRSPAEQDVITTYQAIAKAIVGHDAGEWAKHAADEFVLYGSGHAPITKSDRIATIERQKESNAVATVGEVQTMRLSVFGDGGAMIATETPADKSRPAYRVIRVWTKRDGRWQMAISAHTDIK